jgi:hypothetical protein
MKRLLRRCWLELRHPGMDRGEWLSFGFMLAVSAFMLIKTFLR